MIPTKYPEATFFKTRQNLPHAACRQKRRGRFVTAAALVNELVEAKQAAHVKRLLARWRRYYVIALDEVGYVPLADIGAEFLFQVIAEGAERKAIIVTTNLPFSEWTTVFPNPRLCKALLDRVTDRAHIIEDKLYSPDSAAGRLGLLELRAFEMPPHARMSLVQMLLVRTLVARFWKLPYRHPLVRWGTVLHDRFMLPHYVWTDVREVVEELRDAGYPFELEWLAPFFEFRFPPYGSVTIGDIRMELRAAIEPWHVLGEEVTSAGTARFVDSSVERLQIRITGLTERRYVIACNGRQVPLQGTSTLGEYVAGVRFRAWQPPSGLHPTIGVHAPLVFDLIDTWNGRAVGGCTYHVAHPGGRGYGVFPVNAYEAEARRVSRFWANGHTPGVLRPPPQLAVLGQFFPHGHPPGPMAPPPEVTNSEYPCTLDLRRGG